METKDTVIEHILKIHNIKNMINCFIKDIVCYSLLNMIPKWALMIIDLIIWQPKRDFYLTVSQTAEFMRQRGPF